MNSWQRKFTITQEDIERLKNINAYFNGEEYKVETVEERNFITNALIIALKIGRLEPGTYESSKYENNWRKCADE
jgi:cytochrome b subunit of formate dehydrogenase